jgi:hypothetical protein
MKTKDEVIAQLKIENPTIRVGSDLIGYTEVTPEEYEATILQWADKELADEAKKEAEAQAKIDKAALLTRLGITAEEAQLLLGGS